MVHAERPFPDVLRAFVQRLRLSVAALTGIEPREFVENHRGAGIVGPPAFADFERALVERFRLGIVASATYESPCFAYQAVGEFSGRPLGVRVRDCEQSQSHGEHEAERAADCGRVPARACDCKLGVSANLIVVQTLGHLGHPAQAGRTRNFLRLLVIIRFRVGYVYTVPAIRGGRAISPRARRAIAAGGLSCVAPLERSPDSCLVSLRASPPISKLRLLEASSPVARERLGELLCSRDLPGRRARAFHYRLVNRQARAGALDQEPIQLSQQKFARYQIGSARAITTRQL